MMRRVLKSIGAVAAKFDHRDVVLLIALGLVFFGVRQVYPPAALIVGGLALGWYALFAK